MKSVVNFLNAVLHALKTGVTWLLTRYCPSKWNKFLKYDVIHVIFPLSITFISSFVTDSIRRRHFFPLTKMYVYFKGFFMQLSGRQIYTNKLLQKYISFLVVFCFLFFSIRCLLLKYCRSSRTLMKGLSLQYEDLILQCKRIS